VENWPGDAPVGDRTHVSGPRADVDPTEFARAFRHHPAGVTIVTLDSGRGPVGFTATSVTSVSARPPLLSFSVATASSCWPAVRDGDTCVVNVLAAHQHGVARRFALRGVDRFGPPTSWERLSSGEPVVCGARLWVCARIVERVPAGDHRVVIARVTDIHPLSVEGRPLVYHDGEYASLAPVRVSGPGPRGA
jgi:flavin reductase (DIM6/NTAB) family NADH-FMN oxidoreductase RutF